MFWLPPVLFSTTNGWLHMAWRFCASVRAIVSGDPPGGSGTTMRTARSGYPWAREASEKAAASSPMIQRFTAPPPMTKAQFTYLARTGIRCPFAHFTGRGGFHALQENAHRIGAAGACGSVVGPGHERRQGHGGCGLQHLPSAYGAHRHGIRRARLEDG